MWRLAASGRPAGAGRGRDGGAGLTDLGTPALLAGRYELGPVIGTGGMARVHRATDTLLGRPVAVKLFRLDSDPMHAARIQNEARTLASVQHPGLVAVFDAGTWSREDGADVPYLIMELVDGPTLAECCLDGSLPPDEGSRIGAELADALGHVHACGIVHRDVKPANILLDGSRRPKLTDFGIARIVDNARYTQTGLTVGTAAYLSPEQVRGQDVGAPSDVYSLGLVLLEVLTGRREYDGNSVETALARLERPPQVPEGLGEPLQTLLTRMTASDPQQRPTAAEVAAALRSGTLPHPPTRVLTTSPSTTAAPDAASELARTKPRPQIQAPEPPARVLRETMLDAARTPYALAGVLALLLLLGLTALVAGGDDAGSPTPAPASQLEKDLAELREAVTP